MKVIQNALITVYHKEKLDVIATELHRLNINIFSTGGTYNYLQELGIPAKTVESLTGYPSIFGGRVKTLHPVVMGGILYRRENPDDIKQVEQYNIPSIDLVIVDLYPFEDTLKQTDDESEIIEKIDIGGISLIRSAAKNFNDVLCVPSQEYYPNIIEILRKGGATSLEQRKQFASYCFKVSSHYDTVISNWFMGETHLRYGENPHQSAVFHGNIKDCFEQLNGKEISYNNLLDIDAAVSLINDFDKYTFAIIKHNNACGVAIRDNLLDAWKDALAGDPVSAFGGVLICNGKLDAQTAEAINTLFFEILIAPNYEPEALEILKSKKNRIILKQKNFNLPEIQYRTLLTGVIEQEKDTSIEMVESLNYPTQQRPTQAQMDDLLYANRLVKHTKSNAIVLVKNGQLLASGMGQTSRVDALNQAIAKAKRFNMNLSGSVMASDAFFPFSDCVEIAVKEGIVSIIQPGGSVRDKESIDACDKAGISMVFTGIRHFKH
ncbi:MAG: bifunctional phosphoribosylaminoimidazolecarboxamide formyltransferase/IMP cyclohydrolase [Bacteroidales bacterium]|jgi:phosphoribosylaminoimidazolecarboxamide formyltransferase/IMP cyclohydrolase|nr:bifunctional phosphoribosylaminoimidazolecarboxamide formyltransferase/IMP cyclohydrolase [Bacteroidales bacterium]